MGSEWVQSELRLGSEWASATRYPGLDGPDWKLLVNYRYIVLFKRLLVRIFGAATLQGGLVIKMTLADVRGRHCEL